MVSTRDAPEIGIGGEGMILSHAFDASIDVDAVVFEGDVIAFCEL